MRASLSHNPLIVKRHTRLHRAQPLPGEHRLSADVSRLVRARRLPYEYYGLPFCQPETMETVAENLGEVLRGDKIMNSNYELKMGVEETCKILCKKELAATEAREFATR